MSQTAVSEAPLPQLRAHLGYLKLNDAADALPRVLDAPRGERLSLTAALERLLEIEVNATEARKLAGRLRFAFLPEPWTIRLDFAAQPGVDEKLIRHLATLRFLDDAPNVLFVGPLPLHWSFRESGTAPYPWWCESRRRHLCRPKISSRWSPKVR